MMGLTKRIIPTLLHRGSSLVKGKQFAGDRVVGHALQSARTMAHRGVDELVLLNIGATPAGQGPDFNMVRELCKDSFTPIAVGGGIGCVAHVKDLLASGADKVVIRTSERTIMNAARILGSQAIIAAVDVMDILRHSKVYEDEPMENMVQRQHVVDHCKVMQMCGAGEIFLTNVDREGMMNGYDLEMIERVSKAVSIPVIAHGGCGTPQHMLEAIQAGASAVAAGSMFLFTDTTPADCAKYLHDHGVEVRLPKEMAV